MANEIIESRDSEAIKNKIYTIRGREVMLDSDLAVLYGVTTKRLNEQVKRNIDRFPDDFMFRLTAADIDLVRSQIATSRESKLFTGQEGGRRYMPYVFTEQGISMLSSVLRSEIATKASISIMRTFVEMRRFLYNNHRVFERLNDVELRQIAYQKKTDERFDEVFDYIAEKKEVSQKIFFDGQIYDAFSLLSDIVSKAKKEIILIDGYVDYKTLDILCKKKMSVEVVIYTNSNSPLRKTDITNFNKQYKGLSIKHTSKFHDRFMIIDGSIAYHIGASLKDAGKKSFAINKLIDNSMITDILSRL